MIKVEKIDKLKELVNQFKYNIKQYRDKGYDEANTRVDFIDKFFELYDWDISNKEGYSEDYREVIREDKIIIQGKPKAPDYSFRIGGVRKFFVEAKKPSVYIKEEIDPAYQVRRYGYTAKLPLSILTDFEEFAVYDTRILPSKTDKASVARIFYCTYEEYEKNYDFIYDTFSKTAILKGSFDRYAKQNEHKKGTGEVDKKFLELIDNFREELAKNIALRNKDFDIYQINYAVQKIIDRIIFLRITEDRGTEKYKDLYNSVNNKNAYIVLNKLFSNSNNKYNGELFKNDDFLNNLTIDDKILKEIIGNLYYPDCPYEFSVMPIETLGNIYEQFLGKTIKLTPTHQAKIEEKPEVRKAGGVYYTPKYIVDYIVENTVGAKIKDKSPLDIEQIKILDPACGSGSFLIGAYNYLLNYHLNYYTNEKNIKTALKQSKIYQISEKHYHLTIQEKQNILINNIFGVDIDPQAVEVTKLSLMLKLMENETKESEGFLFKHSDIKFLPNLSNNIKCGNSLIGSDYYKEQDTLFEKDTMRKINAFDWENEFPGIFKNRGFDVVIGNPPYVQSRNETIEENEKQYYYKNYKTSEYQLNTYGLFIEKSIKLIKKNALLGLIVPNYWLSTDNDKLLRKLAFFDNKTLELINIYQVFENANVDTLILLLQKEISSINDSIITKSIDKNLNSINDRLLALNNKIWSIINEIKLDSLNDDFKISFSKSFELKGECKLKDFFTLKKGMQPYEEGKGKPKQTRKMMDDKIYDSKKKIDKSYKPLLKARNVKRYYINWENDWIKYGENLAAPRSPEIFEGERIIIQRIISSNKIIGTYTDENYISNTDIITLKPIINTFLRNQFFAGILLSRLCAFYIKSRNVNLDRKVFPKINVNTLENFPIPSIIDNGGLKPTVPLDYQKIHDSLVSLVDQMIETQKEYRSLGTDDFSRRFLKQKIDLIDNQIDDLVYKLYELTDEEIKIIEG